MPRRHRNPIPGRDIPGRLFASQALLQPHPLPHLVPDGGFMGPGGLHFGPAPMPFFGGPAMGNTFTPDPFHSHAGFPPAETHHQFLPHFSSHRGFYESPYDSGRENQRRNKAALRHDRHMANYARRVAATTGMPPHYLPRRHNPLPHVHTPLYRHHPAPLVHPPPLGFDGLPPGFGGGGGGGFGPFGPPGFFPPPPPPPSSSSRLSSRSQSRYTPHGRRATFRSPWGSSSTGSTSSTRSSGSSSWWSGPRRPRRSGYLHGHPLHAGHLGARRASSSVYLPSLATAGSSLLWDDDDFLDLDSDFLDDEYADTDLYLDDDTDLEDEIVDDFAADYFGRLF